MSTHVQQRVHSVRAELVQRGHFDRGDVRRVISEFTGSESGHSTARARRPRGNRRSRRRVVHLVDAHNVSRFQDSTHTSYKFIRISKGFYFK